MAINQGNKAYLVGGGIASLASAAYLIRDGQVPGSDIHIFEESGQIGGALDAHGSPEKGYVMRGGRMFTEEAYTCTFDLMSFIPSLDDPTRTIKDEFFEFNETFKSHSQCRLMANGQKVDVSSNEFSTRDRMDLMDLAVASEESLGMTQIDEYFEPEFFTSDFWFMWCTTFAFQPWHSAVEFKRYLLRFIQEFPRISTLAGVKRTPYNQYESIVLPLVTWLEGQGVHFEMNSQVTNLAFLPSKDIVTVERIHYIRDGKPADIAVRVDDHVMVTLGSMTAGSTHGSMDSEPRLGSKLTGGSWLLWESLAATNAQFGHPSVFDSDIEKSMWESFTLTLNDPLFFRLMKDFTGNEAGTGGLVTFKDSNWLMSIVLPRQPHFRNQPGKINVCWGYGLFPNRKGNFVQKTMSECTGSEILTELLSHLRFTEEAASIQQSAICIPVMMPFITSQFMPRLKGDRPLVRPEGSTNLAFIGQFCEIPDEVVFTVEYSVRSAQTAVFSLLNLKKEISPIYKGQHDLRVLFDSALAMFK